MTVGYVVVIVFIVLTVTYLTYALLYPERF
ncbi:MAG: potassium-transporting ATPase subunit F [Thermoplasmata archaeon]|nr:potassium-transporting ATPase subunit F [Candidatus Sysuiplasma jiujiangense]